MDLANLDKEIRRQAGIVLGHADKRRNHPTYGVTKALLKEGVAQLEGMLLARCAVTGDPTTMPLLRMREHAAVLGLDLEAIRRTAQEA